MRPSHSGGLKRKVTRYGFQSRAEATTDPMAVALGHDSQPLQPVMKDIVTKARATWLKNDEVLKVLLHYKSYQLPIGKEAPKSPGGGLLFLFNRKAVRFFRKDGHEWRKKADGKTVRETHEKLKIGNKEVLNCYYAHSEAQEALQRRCYWLLEGDGDIVLVHYLSSHPTAHPSVLLAPAIDTPEDRTHQGAPQSAQPATGMFSGQIILDRSSSTPIQSGHQPGPSISSARSLDRQNSLGPLHAAPSFSAGTVQTGSTMDGPLCGEVALAQSRPASPVDPPPRSSSNTRIPDLVLHHHGMHVATEKRVSRVVASTSNRAAPVKVNGGPVINLQFAQTEQEAHAKAWEALKRKEREAAIVSVDTLKPAASLTRVDSDTLKVAPSVSGATGGSLTRLQLPIYDYIKGDSGQINIGLHSSASSPFFAAAFLGNMAKPQNPVNELLDSQNQQAGSADGIYTTTSGRVKRYRSGDVTGSNRSFATSMDPELSSCINDVTSSASLQEASRSLAAEQQTMMPMQNLLAQSPYASLETSSTFLAPHAADMQCDWRERDALARPPHLNAGSRWQSHCTADYTQVDRYTRDLDLLLPMDLDWAINLSSNDLDDLRNCPAS